MKRSKGKPQKGDQVVRDLTQPRELPLEEQRLLYCISQLLHKWRTFATTPEVT